MDIAKIVLQMKQGDNEALLTFINQVNPLLCNLFTFFSEQQNINFNIFEEYCLSAYKNVAKLPHDDKTAFTLLSAAMKLLRKKITTEQYQDNIRRLHETLYEDVQLEEFPASFFDPDALVSKERLLRFRNEKLNSARRFLFDLVFAYNLSAAEISRLFQLSENMIDPFIFTCFQQLMGKEVINESFDGFALFSHLLHVPDPPGDDCSGKERVFHERCRRLVQFFSLDILPRFEQEKANAIYYEMFPDKKPLKHTENVAKKEESLIEKIRRRNEAENLQEFAHTTTIEQESGGISSAAIKADERAFKLIKPAAAVLVVFFVIVIQKTLSVPDDKLDSDVSSGTVAVALEDLHKTTGKSFGKNNCSETQDIKPGQRIFSRQEECAINIQGHLEINLQSSSEIQVINEHALFLQKGAVSLSLNWQDEELQINTPDGEVKTRGKKIYLAKHEAEYTTVGVQDGELNAICAKGNRKLKSGQETRLGNPSGKESLITPFNPNSYTYYQGKKNFLKANFRGLDNAFGYNTTVTQEEKEKIIEALPETKILLNEPHITPPSFLHEL